jgi:cobalamin synthase
MITEHSRPHMTRILRDHAIGLGLVAIAGLVAVTSVAVVAGVAAAGRHSGAFP